jgi:surface protein
MALAWSAGPTAEYLPKNARSLIRNDMVPANTWVRPADWVALPTLGPTDQRFVGLFGVYNCASNFLAFTFTGTGSYVVNWGDGGAPETVASGVTAYHSYDYTAASLAGTEHYDSAGNVVYRQAVVSVTMASGNMTAVNLNVKHNQSSLPSAYVCPWLDISLNGPNITGLTISAASVNVYLYELKQVKIGIIGAVTDISYMFYNCYSLVSVPLFNTSAVTNMSAMFNNCSSLVSVPLFNTSAVTDMSYMFSYCQSLVSVPLFNISAVTNMSAMFNNCSSLVSVPLFNTSAVTNMSYMFYNCYSLVAVPLFNTSAVTNMSYMFSYCYSLVSVPLFNTSAVTNMSFMFSYCNSLVAVPLFNTSAVTNMSYMFYNCYSLVSVPLFNTSAVTNMSAMFNNCYSLVSVPLFNTSAVTNISYMFVYCQSLVSVPAFALSAVTTGNADGAFSNTYGIRRAPLIGLGISFTLNSMMGPAELNELYTSLPSVTSKTLTVSGNWGYAASTASIATGKGWTLA